MLSACSGTARAGESLADDSVSTLMYTKETEALQKPLVMTTDSAAMLMTATPTLHQPSSSPTDLPPGGLLSTPYANKRITEEAPLPSCLFRGGQVIQSSFPTNLLPLPLDYRLYLPPCYRQNSDQHYPLLILIHGQSFTDDQWDRLGVDEMLDSLTMKGDLPPFLVLMPRDRYGGESPENNFARVVVEQLLPVIDDTYRTMPERQYRAVGGLSRGAGWAVHIGMTYWQEFSRIGAHSPAIFYSDAQKMRTWLDTIPKDEVPQVFVDIGERDRPEILDSAFWFADLLDEKDVPHEWYLFAGFHNEEYWSLHLEKYLRWYAKNW